MKLIGGQKLKELGSTRHTDDSDYIIFDSSKDVFTHDAENKNNESDFGDSEYSETSVHKIEKSGTDQSFTSNDNGNPN